MLGKNGGGDRVAISAYFSCSSASPLLFVAPRAAKTRTPVKRKLLRLKLPFAGIIPAASFKVYHIL